ncbi:hypothetical protein CEXT_732881 [Caerostris extrusa]|uniref:Uncharacterized protein n=1 Tax=Caerostris extrusa TaxID=172846 RepID=A0AAV4QX23_CAEEX|nr:hypothetical protein CEXT_732881 [Caerostris extrusa]
MSVTVTMQKLSSFSDKTRILKHKEFKPPKKPKRKKGAVFFYEECSPGEPGKNRIGKIFPSPKILRILRRESREMEIFSVLKTDTRLRMESNSWIGEGSVGDRILFDNRLVFVKQSMALSLWCSLNSRHRKTKCCSRLKSEGIR